MVVVVWRSLSVSPVSVSLFWSIFDPSSRFSDSMLEPMTVGRFGCILYFSHLPFSYLYGTIPFLLTVPRFLVARETQRESEHDDKHQTLRQSIHQRRHQLAWH